MAKWNDYIKTEEYQSKPVMKKLEAKRQFFRDNIYESETYNNLPKDKQRIVEMEFMGTRHEEEGTSLKQQWRETPIARGLNWADDKFRSLIDKTPIAPKFIDPNQSKWKTYGVDFPRTVAAETAKQFAPSDVLAFLAMSKGLKVAGKAFPHAGSRIAAAMPASVKKKLAPAWKFLNKNLTVGKGQPKAYQILKKEADLDKLGGMREADDVVKILTTTPDDMLIKEAKLGKATGKVKKVKAGKELPPEQQRYLGRLFRKEVDLGGKRATAQTAEDTARMFKEIEVNVGFSKKVQGGYKQLKAIDKKLRNPKLKAKSQVGKVGEYGITKVEEATAVNEFQRFSKKGKLLKKPGYDIVSEPITPTTGNIPSNLGQGGEVTRGIKQVANSKAHIKPTGAERKALLAERKAISKNIQKEIQDIEVGVRSSYHIFDRKWTEQIRNHPKFKELNAIATEGRTIMDKWSKELIKSGIPTEEANKVIAENTGTYMARMYPKYALVEPTGAGYSKKAMRLKLDGLKHRKNLSEKVLNTMIKEPALPVGTRVKEISNVVTNEGVFKTVAANPEWASKTPVEGWTKMGSGKNLGSLKDLYVLPEIAADVNTITSFQTPGIATTLYTKGLSAWKYGKVVLNPATHARNTISNSMLLDFSGVNHIQQVKLYPKAFSSLIKKDATYKMALEDGAIGGEFVGGEVQKLKEWYMKSGGSNMQKWMNVLRMPIDAPGKIYQAEEQASKLVKYMHVLKKTGNRKLAASEAQKWLFNYDEIPNIIKAVKHVSPFITFTYKAVPRVAETLVNNPMKLYKYKAFFNGWNEASVKTLGMTPQEYARTQDALPPWVLRDMGGVPMNLLMPFKDNYDRTQWLNLEYMMPLGLAPDLMDAASNQQTGENPVQNVLKSAISNPYFTALRDLSSNKDFKNSDIIPAGSTTEEANEIAMGYIYKQAFPTFMPGWKGIKGWEGGYSYSKIRNSLDKMPDHAGRLRDLGVVMFDVFTGLKLNPVSVPEAEFFKMKDKEKLLKEYQKQLFRLNHPAITPDKRAEEAAKIFEKMQKMMKQ